MTKGKLINNKTGLMLTGSVWVKYIDRVLFLIDGDYEAKTFARSVWTFIEDKPTAYEVIKAMKPGTVFAGAGVGATRYIRLDEDYYYSTFSNAVSQLTEHSFGSRFEAHEVEL